MKRPNRDPEARSLRGNHRGKFAAGGVQIQNAIGAHAVIGLNEDRRSSPPWADLRVTFSAREKRFRRALWLNNL